MDYKKVLRLHYENKLSGREIAATSGCSKTSVNEFLKRFRECQELSYPLSEDVTNEFIEKLLEYQVSSRFTGTSTKKLFIKLSPEKERR